MPPEHGIADGSGVVIRSTRVAGSVAWVLLLGSFLAASASAKHSSRSHIVERAGAPKDSAGWNDNRRPAALCQNGWDSLIYEWRKDSDIQRLEMVGNAPLIMRESDYNIDQ